jgi:diguanylate cyclase (GGDEF)-like protein/PAS domain S-box-containing protein
MNILVVDDNAANVYMLMVLLPAHGHAVETAADGVEALEKLAAYPIDLIISDILMPRMDGFQLCREVRADERWRNLPFIFYTATYTSDNDEKFALSLGADRFLVKPQPPDQFMLEVQRVIKNRTLGLTPPPEASIDSDATYLREYNERLIKKLEDKMLQVEQEKERYRVTLGAIADGIISVDTNRRITHLNPAAEAMTGWAAPAAIGMALPAVCQLVTEVGRQPYPDPIGACFVEDRFVEPSEPLLLRNRDNIERAVDLVVTRTHNPQGELVGHILTLRDVTEKRKLSRQISFQATHDALTGLLNRYEFERRLQGLLSRGAGEHALLYLDLDQFKVVNDTRGHGAGDELLRQLGHALRSRTRARDTLARLGGDEFGMILEDCPAEQAMRVGEELRQVVQDFTFIWEGQSYQLGISIGIAPLPAAGSTPAAALSAADSACYAAKGKGRNRLHLYHVDDAELTQRRGEMEWLPRLQQALVENRFQLHLQPIVSLQGQDEGAMSEVLLRLIDENGEIVLPGVFIPAAERYNQAPALDRWVVDRTIRLLEGGASPLPHCLSVNLSGQSICSEDFLAFLKARVSAARFDAGRLCFEITETAAIMDLTQAITFVSEMRRLGCNVALDDFGSGLSSFNHLRQLPVNMLKIDGRFVRNVTRDAADCAVVVALMQLGRTLGLRIVAEWAEDEPTVAKLRKLGVDFAQGHAVGRPAPVIVTTRP